MLISHATQAAPGVERNEDCVVTGPDFAVVLDGATAAPGVDSGCIHDVPWLVGRLGAELSRLLLTESLDLAETLGLAIQGVMALHADTCDLINPDSPSSTVAIVRDRGQSVDYLALSDSPIVFRKLDGTVEVVHDNRNDYLPGYTVEIVRQQRNAPGGFWVASNKPEAAKEALTGSIARATLDCVGLFTDGASRLAERHGLRWAGLIRLLGDEGPAAIIDRVRREDERTAGHHPGKVHDDATAVLCRFPES
ncbi:MAG TPA: protein phosphatase 2C domain-containing protein [Nocardioidaceae bacterium]|nr:protein phosphatase 2C domain-containing protein [Nocardioidaceae bacterium]